MTSKHLDNTCRFLITCCCIVFSCCLTLKAEEAFDLKVLNATWIKHFSTLKNVKVDFDVEAWMKGLDSSGKDEPSRTKFSFVGRYPKFYLTIDTSIGDAQKRSLVKAFDGSVYQTYEKASRELTYTKEPVKSGGRALGAFPFIHMFLPLAPQKDTFVLHDLIKPEFWDSVLTGMTYVGQSGNIVEMEIKSQTGVTVKYFLDRSMGFYPVKWTAGTADSGIECKVVSFFKVKTDSGEITLPKVIHTTSHTDKVKDSDITITVSEPSFSLTPNEDASLYLISPDFATTVLDADLNEFLKSPSKEVLKSEEPKKP